MTEERVNRKLAAILAAHVVGYSRLMGADEERTLAGAETAPAGRVRPGGCRP
jgi:adenylate cyclase